MALSDSAFSSKLQSLFESMDSGAMSVKDFSDKLAKAVDDQIKTAGIPAGSVIVGVAGQATGTPNPSPIQVV